MKSKIEKQRKVALVGAGPGREDLITIAGLREIQQADVILYDALVNPRLLNHAKAEAQLIYVGKRSGKHSLAQNEINILLLECALTQNRVARLKGGDPFVFGRASEEIEYLESFGISVEVIPGVSSAISVPASQGIPLTKRGISTSFWVMTATTKEGGFSNDLILAAQSSATMVILMGVRKIHQIVMLVKDYRSGLTPIALIQNGTLPEESCITATLNSTENAFETIDKTQPGIIVIGDVVADHTSFYDEEIQRVLYSYI
ncbi:uroporphyrinogen-III C-methyltransferase [Flagellimonas sp. CMM7]|uniref:uroporphyrinogen-III C-methyltransferase n=1 Tax=Flagellimonas sp. CMM7 TaxID=2654676 RepID=UPI0013D8DFA1|nr:uroporphyrinogen-III C-methyltransferase [Flagellimonas sp. CMM7]UII81272.1 uroporphyrinogen-III C-methyltransferase [Flagellimonas sp. CMM7]